MDAVRRATDQYPACVVLVQVGDFYELYEQHATTYAPLLDLKLTRKQMASDLVVAFAGFPSRALDRYLETLVNRLGCRVAVCEQVGTRTGDDEKANFGMERMVTRVITPGTVLEDRYLSGQANNYLVSIQPQRNGAIELAWVDVSIGDVLVQETTTSALRTDLLRIQPREILLPLTFSAAPHVDEDHDATPLDAETQLWMQDHFAVTTTQPMDEDTMDKDALPDAFDALLQTDAPCKSATMALLRYINATHLHDKPQLAPPTSFQSQATLHIDSAAMASLELLQGQRDGRRQDGLLGLLDRTSTFAGSRLLTQWLTAPLAHLQAIGHRLDIVDHFVHHPDQLDDIRDLLRQATDAQRSLQRLTLTRETPANEQSNGQSNMQISQRSRLAADLIAVGRTLAVIQSIGPLLRRHRAPPCLQTMMARLDPHDQLLASLTSAFLDDFQGDGDQADENEVERENGLIHRDYHASLRQLYDALGVLEERKAALLVQLREAGGRTLVLQWQPQPMVEVSAARAKKLEAEVEGLTLVHGTKTKKRYHLTAWAELSMAMDDTYKKITQWEHVLLQGLVQKLAIQRATLVNACKALAELDVLTTFAWLARHHAWIKPTLVDTLQTRIEGGRHPVVEMHLARKGRAFVPNDLVLANDNNHETHENENDAVAWLLTGPNMGGKSTFLRQNALIVILAHMGCFVPARKATIGLTDRIFTRVGAADNLANDQSTFFVEMAETATILRDATPRSLVIMDEVGRGTATNDGFSLAYAILHHLHSNIRCRALFATHYHELADATHHLPHLKCYKTTMYEDNHAFTFLHRIQPGICRASHGLKVAQLAGKEGKSAERGD
ncbi:muts domain V-domain-containing protein [Gongronella butleri]|nr:muts domain V-domain-containing protein [Gongronella butleri]